MRVFVSLSLLFAISAIAVIAQNAPEPPTFPADFSSYQIMEMVKQPQGNWYLDEQNDICCPVDGNCAVQSQGQSGTLYWDYTNNRSRSDSDGTGQFILSLYDEQNEYAFQNGACQFYCPMQGDVMTPGPVDWSNVTLSFGGYIEVDGETYPSWNWTTFMMPGVPVETSQFAADLNTSSPVYEYDNITMFGQFEAFMITRYQTFYPGTPSPGLFNYNVTGCPAGSANDCGNNSVQMLRLKQKRINTFRYYHAMKLLAQQEQENRLQHQILTNKLQAKKHAKAAKKSEAKREHVRDMAAIAAGSAPTEASLIHIVKKKADKPVPQFPTDYSVFEMDTGATFQGPYKNLTTSLCCNLESQCMVQTEYQGVMYYFSSKANATRTDYNVPPPTQTQIAFFTQQRDCLVVNGVCTEYCPLQGDTFSSGFLDPNATYTGSVVMDGKSYDMWSWYDWLGIGNITMSSSTVYIDPTTTPQTPYYEYDVQTPFGMMLGYSYESWSQFNWAEPDASLFAVTGINTAPQAQNCGNSQAQALRKKRGLMKTYHYYEQLNKKQALRAAFKAL